MLLGLLQLNLTDENEQPPFDGVSMAYCLEADVRIHAPQAQEGFDLDPYITQAGGVIDANLNALYDLPLASIPQLLRNCASLLSAGYYLKAHYAKINQSPPAFADKLCEQGLQILMDIRNDPALLGIELKIPDETDYDQNSIHVGETDNSAFPDSSELNWGTQ